MLHIWHFSGKYYLSHMLSYLQLFWSKKLCLKVLNTFSICLFCPFFICNFTQLTWQHYVLKVSHVNKGDIISHLIAIIQCLYVRTNYVCACQFLLMLPIFTHVTRLIYKKCLKCNLSIKECRPKYYFMYLKFRLVLW